MSSRSTARLAALVLVAGLPLSAMAQPPQPASQPVAPTQAPAQPVIISKPATTTVVDPHGHPVQPTDPAAAAAFPLKFEHTAFDFGDIPDTDKATHAFKFTNGSDKTVSIAGLQGSCGCTAGTLAKNDYAPNESGEITVTFDPTNRVGPQPKTLTVSLKEGGTFILNLTANVKPFVFLDNQKLQFMEIMKGTETTQGFTVIGRSADFEVLGVDVANPDVVSTTVEPVVVVEENGEKLRKVHVKVANKPGLAVGVASAQLTVRTNDTRKPTLTAMATVQMVGELRTAPPMMYVRQNQPSVQFEGDAMIDNRLNKPFDITSIDVEGPTEMQLVADFTTNPDGPGYRIKLSGVTPPIPGQFRGTVIVRTDVADEGEIKIGFFCNVFNANGTMSPVTPKPMQTGAPTVGAAPGNPIAPVPLSPVKNPGATPGSGH